MIRFIRIIEVPIYLLVIGLGCINEGSETLGIILLATSILRLWTNHITDEFIYKN